MHSIEFTDFQDTAVRKACNSQDILQGYSMSSAIMPLNIDLMRLHIGVMATKSEYTMCPVPVIGLNFDQTGYGGKEFKNRNLGRF